MKHLNFRWQFDKFHHFRPHRHYKQRSDRANKKPVDSRNPFREHYGIQSSRSQSTWISKTHFTKFPNLCASSLQHRSVKTIQKTVDSPDQVREHYITQVSDHKPREFLETIWKKKSPISPHHHCNCISNKIMTKARIFIQSNWRASQVLKFQIIKHLDFKYPFEKLHQSHHIVSKSEK